MESFSSTSYSKLDDHHAWSSQEWKTDIETYERSGRPDQNFMENDTKNRPDHEEILVDGTAQSVRYGETLRDRSWRPDNIISQEVARPQNSIMGNEETELELSVESRQKRISNVAGDKEEQLFNNLGNVYGCNNGISDIHG